MPIVLEGQPIGPLIPGYSVLPVSLTTLEQEVARRTGPFFQAAQDAGTPTSSTTIAAYMPTLKSSALVGGPENLWLIRRGILSDGLTPTPQPVVAADRARMVQTFDSGSGRVVIDRNWTYPMQPDELADFTHLHPQELYRAIIAGLRRCYAEDRGQVGTYITTTGDVDLTQELPWLTNPDQILRVQAGWPGAYYDIPYDPVVQAGHVMLSGGVGWVSPGALWLTAARPHWSWVNGADSTTGPILDSDTLSVDLDYAAAAAHIEAWHLFPSRLQAAAAGNFQATQKMAADEFTRQALIWAPQTMREVRFPETFRLSGV